MSRLPSPNSKLPSSIFHLPSPNFHLPSSLSGPPYSAQRATFLGCPVDLYTTVELLAEIEDVIRQRRGPRVIQFVNANKVAQVRDDPAMGDILRRADYVLMDGQPLLPMARLLGIRVPERVDGIGLMRKLLQLAARHHHSVYLLGAREEVLAACVRRIQAEFPGLTIAGFRNGYFTPAETESVVAQVRAVRPDLLFLGMGTPAKERLADAYRDAFGATIIQGVGGSFDILAGIVKRAPIWVQRLGFEWLYRVLQEPRRMAWRYARTNAICLAAFAGALLRHGRHAEGEGCAPRYVQAGR